MKFTDLNDKSTALNLTYEQSTLRCDYEDSILQKKYVIEIRCPSYRPTFYSAVSTGLKGLARVKLEELSNILDIDSSGKYRLKNGDIAGMKFGAFLAIGMPADIYKYLATIDTEFRLVYCSVVVSSESDVKVYKK